MIFNIDYKDFLNLNDCTAEQFKTVKTDFISNITDLLRDMGCNSYMTESIGYTLFSSMVHDKVYYHTPVHILYALSFAQDNHVPLENWEKLAIFFHDAIYRPGGKNNEGNSAIFMNALLDNTGMDEHDIAMATKAIESTARHLDDNIPQEHWNVMDLDLAGFASNPKPFNLQNQLIEMEFCQPKKNGYGCTLEQFLQGRIAFLTALQNRKSMYHTELFKVELNMEDKAHINLENQIKETNRRLDNLNRKKKIITI